MRKLIVDGVTHEVDAGKRLVPAIEESGVKIGHRSGGFAKCTTDRMEFLEGEPLLSDRVRSRYERAPGHDFREPPPMGRRFRPGARAYPRPGGNKVLDGGAE